MTIVKFSPIFHPHGRELGHDEPYMNSTTLESDAMEEISDEPVTKMLVGDYDLQIHRYII